MPELPRRSFLRASAAMLAGAAVLQGCGHRTAAGGFAMPSPDISGPNSLKEHAANAHLLFGFAVDVASLRSNLAYRRAVQEQCSILVAENAMKWDALRPTRGSFHFDDADYLLQFAESNHIKLRGHSLCWYQALPPWFDREANPANARELLTEHIRTVAGRYTGRMHSWDVVNEAIEVKDGRTDGLRNSPWLRLIGPDYIEVAFRAAREADPSALLAYNDYGMEYDTHDGAEKRAAVLLLLRRLKQRNVPIDAVGIQSHLKARSMYGYGTGLRQFIDACRGMDMEVFLSEMDVNDQNLPANTDQRDEAVAAEYRRYLGATLPAKNITAVLTWGVGDSGTWMNTGDHARQDGKPQRPLLLDDRLQPKPAFAAVREAFDQRFPPSRPAGTGPAGPAPRLPRF